MKNDYTVAIDKMNRETKEGKLVWEECGINSNQIAGDEKILGKAYTTRVSGKRIRIYPCQEKKFDPDCLWYWSSRIRLEFIDDSGHTEWEFPSNNAIYLLYDSIQFKTANIENFLNDYTENESKQEDYEFPDY